MTRESWVKRRFWTEIYENFPFRGISFLPSFTRTHALITAAINVWSMAARKTPLAHQQTFFQLLHNIDLRTVDALLKDTPDAV